MDWEVELAFVIGKKGKHIKVCQCGIIMFVIWDIDQLASQGLQIFCGIFQLICTAQSPILMLDLENKIPLDFCLWAIDWSYNLRVVIYELLAEEYKGPFQTT